MKKYLAVVLAVVMAVACCAVLAGCTQPVTTTGSYHYENPWAAGSYYGCEATVTVKGDTIESVVISEDSATGWTNLSAGWTDKGIYEAAEEDYIAGFAGESVEDVLAAEVELNAKGVPQSVTEAYLVAGATQTSGRVVLAIQSALGKHTAVGSYHSENPWAAGSYYGCAVKVVTNANGKITSVSVFSDEATGWTNLSAGWGDRQIYIDGETAFIASFANANISDVLGIAVTVNASGVPQTLGTTTHVVTGATQTCGRVILAVQAALGRQNLVTPE